MSQLIAIKRNVMNQHFRHFLKRVVRANGADNKIICIQYKKQTNSVALSPRANYTD
jgi:hypothetical protein